jgi:small subunit ribosomal protein S23
LALIIVHIRAIRFAVNLHTAHNMPLSKAYAFAVAQFRALRGEAQIAASVAAAEAESYGGKFGLTEVERTFEKEEEALQTWQRAQEMDEGALAARKRWRAIVERTTGTGEWSRGEQYTRLWKEGVRPNYALTEPVTESITTP